MVSAPLQMLSQMDIHQSRFDDGVTVAIVNFENLFHACQGDHDTTTDGKASSGEARPCAAWDEGDVKFVTDFHDGNDLFGGRGEDHDIG